jgi:hypothetical protein
MPPRKRMGKVEKQALEAWLDNHLDCPFPMPDDEKAALKEQTKLTDKQIDGWFKKRRKEIDDEIYAMDLVGMAASLESILEQVARSAVYRAYHTSALLPCSDGGLSQDEVAYLLDPKRVDWDDLHTKLLEGIYDNRATGKTNAATRCRQFTDTKFNLFNELQLQYPDFLQGASERKKLKYRCAIDSLAAEFARLLENSIVKGGGDLYKEIEKVLEGDWRPTGSDHEQTVYYIAGYSIRAASNVTKTKKHKHLHVHLSQLVENAAFKAREEAVKTSLPTERVEKTEEVKLFYPTKEYYESILSLESVFHSLLNDENVLRFGTLMIADMVEHLSKIDLGFSQFMPDADKDDVAAVANIIVDSYSNLRGKDYARKRNNRMGATQTETLRSRLGTIDFLHKLKKEKRLKEAKEKILLEESEGDKKMPAKANETEDEKEEEAVVVE